MMETRRKKLPSSLRASVAATLVLSLSGCKATLGDPPRGDDDAGDASADGGSSTPGDPGDPGEPGDPGDPGPSGGDSSSGDHAGDTGSPATRECDSAPAAWIWCDDFETDRSDSYFEGSTTLVAGAGVGGSVGARFVYTPGTSGAGGLNIAFGRTPSAYFTPVDDGTSDYREIYWRLMLRHQPGWVGGGGNKLSRATVFVDANWAQAMIAHVWSGGADDNYLGIDPASGTDTAGVVQTTTYNDFDNLRWLGWLAGTTPLFDAAHVGEWYCIEAHARLNDAGSANGVFELWIDETLQAQHQSLNWLGSYDGYGINAVFFENYWNDTSPVVQERTFDNLVVSTAPIGCP